MTLRATVKIRDRDDESDDGLVSEWVHEGDLVETADGVSLIWDNGLYRTFVPWGSVVRIDFEPCRCATCDPSTARRAA